MNIFVINIMVDTKHNEKCVYEKVSINKYPIIIMDESMDNVINNDELWTAIPKMFPDAYVYNTAEFYIRTLDENYEVTEFIIPLKSIKSFQSIINS